MTMIYNFVARIAPGVPNWVLSWFSETPVNQVTFWFHALLLALVLVGSYLLTAMDRRYGKTLLLGFITGWINWVPFQNGLYSFSSETNPMFADVPFFQTGQGIALALQWVAGIIFLAGFLRYLFAVFFIAPIKRRQYQHEGSYYRKQAQKEKAKAQKAKIKRQRKLEKQQQQKQQPPKKTAAKQQAHPKEESAPKQATPFTDEKKGNKNDLDFYL